MKSPLFERLLSLLQPATALGYAVALEEWYTRTTHCPSGGRASRGPIRAELEVRAHQAALNPEISDAIDSLMASEEFRSLGLTEQGFVRRVKSSLDRKRVLPDSFVHHHASVCNTAHDAWTAARESKDFSALPAALAPVFASTRERAGYLGADMTRPTSIYNALLQDYEPDFSTTQLLEVLTYLKTQLLPLRRSIIERTRNVDLNMFHNWQLGMNDSTTLCRNVVTRLGFDFDRGGLSFAAHPFCSRVGPDDVQLTMRHVPKVPLAQLFGAVHETGHGLFDQNVPDVITRHMPPGYIYSLGIHESQSRMFENTICRSPEMLGYMFFATNCGYLPSGTTREDLARYANFPHPTPIRVESSELDYNLHVIIRVEVELRVLEGDLKIEDIPAFFDERMQELLGFRPTDLYQGAWQDVHWPTGTIGYFGTYTLGNLAAVQLFKGFTLHRPEWQSDLQTGDLQFLRAWLDRDVWKPGYATTLNEVLSAATGEPLNPNHWLTYISDKYNALYG